jgi:hypothetical protein
MDKTILNEIEGMIRHSFENGEMIKLHEILWTIDSQHRLIPNLEELNEAVKKIKGLKIVYTEDYVELHQVNQVDSDLFTSNHIAKVMEYYNNLITSLKK